VRQIVTAKVITASDLRNISGEFRIPRGTIVTPAARDHADEHGIKLVFCDAIASKEQPSSGSPAITVSLAARIDHTFLHPDATATDVMNHCAEAVEHGFAAVCINPTMVATAARALQGSGVHVCAVVGFPTGAHATSIKVSEAAHCVEAGAQEIDMVASTGLLKDGRYVDYAADIAAVRQRIGTGLILKVIIEAPLLTPEQIIRAATLAAHAGCDYVKTSTGVYAKARREDVQLLRKALPDRVKIKAAGGIRTSAEALAMISAGADRIGTSNSIAIIWESKK
jgi:deoxyribose-phosphate aldolase